MLTARSEYRGVGVLATDGRRGSRPGRPTGTRAAGPGFGAGRWDCARQAWEWGMRCKKHSETFHRDPAGAKLAQERPTNGWERVLRRGGATRPAKRRLRARTPC